MKVTVEGGELAIRLPLNPPSVPSGSGKTLVVGLGVDAARPRPWPVASAVAGV